MGMVKASVGDTVVVFNPIAEAPGLKASKFGADIALVSVNDPGYNGIEQASRGDRVPFAITGPGEYEVGGIFVKGVGTKGPGDKFNTIYSVVWDGIRLVHLGVLGQADLPTKATEQIGEVDILFVPVAASGGITTKEVAKVMTSLSPKIVIPVDYQSDAELKVFLKEAGAESKAAVPSLQVKRKDLVDKETEVVVLATG